MDKILTILQIKFYKLISINFYYYIREKFRYKKYKKSNAFIAERYHTTIMYIFI